MNKWFLSMCNHLVIWRGKKWEFTYWFTKENQKLLNHREESWGDCKMIHSSIKCFRFWPEVDILVQAIQNYSVSLMSKNLFFPRLKTFRIPISFSFCFISVPHRLVKSSSLSGFFTPHISKNLSNDQNWSSGSGIAIL